MRIARLLLPLSLALVVGSAVASTASALTFTLSAPVTLDGSAAHLGVLGSINPVGNVSGTILPVPNQDGTINPGFAGQDVFVVDITLSGGSSAVDAFGMFVGSISFFTNPVGAGAFNDAGDQAPTSVSAIVLTGGLFDFSGDNLTAGETSVRLFITHSPEFDMANGQTVSFMVSSGTDFTVQGTLVPEPGTFLLTALGLAGLTFASRRRR